MCYAAAVGQGQRLEAQANSEDGEGELGAQQAKADACKAKRLAAFRRNTVQLASPVSDVLLFTASDGSSALPPNQKAAGGGWRMALTNIGFTLWRSRPR
jgi:CxxC motif-containing protein (DUF1111 family)